MNVREEDRQKNSCPSRGLGLAAAAIGVGVGAALYYFFSKRPENPDGEGSTTSGWTCEEPHALNNNGRCSRRRHYATMETQEDDSYLTISEHSTTDTSVHDSDDSDEESSSDDEDSFFDSSESEDNSDESESSNNFESIETGYRSGTLPVINNVDSESDTMDWDVTNSSIGVPEEFRSPRSPLRALFGNLGVLISPRPEVRVRTAEDEQMARIRDQAFRERSWSLEECSICFDIILKDQQVTTLPCTHHFHAACIAPWLQEQQTCPNCRKAAE